MKKINICFTLLCGVLTLGSVALAQDAALIQAARKEGKVVWHTSLALPSSTAIAHYFQNKYKGIEVEVHRNGSQRVLQRFMQEAAAGIKNADIVHTSDAGNFELLKDKGMLLKFTPQRVASFPDGFKDKARLYHGMPCTRSVAGQCGKRFHGVYFFQRGAGAFGGLGRSLFRSSRGDRYSRQVQVQVAETAVRGRRRAGKAQLGNKETLHVIIRCVTAKTFMPA